MSDKAPPCPDPGAHRPIKSDRQHMLIALNALSFAEGYLAAVNDVAEIDLSTCGEIVGEAALFLSMHLQDVLAATDTEEPS